MYVCTGDMYDNFPVVRDGSRGVKWSISAERERAGQINDAESFVSSGGFRSLMGSPDAPVVCVRGNHDFVDLSLMFEGCNLIHEFISNEVVEVLGKRITGHRGIPFIYGTWSDEMSRSDLVSSVTAMPDADIFLTHYPPLGVLDWELSRGIEQNYGLEGMREVLTSKMGDNGLHCFGHIHGSGGTVKEFGPGQFIGMGGHLHRYSNAACAINLIDL